MNVRHAACSAIALALVVSALGATSFAAAATNALPEDATWYRKQLIDGEVKPRMQSGLAANGFYRPFLARDWKPRQDQHGTLISQSRAVYVMAAGYEVTGEQVYYDAMIKAADFLLANFADRKQPGRWAMSVSPDGKVLDASFHAYGHAQVIFAMAHAYRATRDKRYLDAAFATWLALDIPRTIQGRNPDLRFDGLNVAMHTFEALLALYKADRSTLILDDLKLLGEHVLARFFEPQRGFFYEFLDASFRPLPAAEIRPGHNLETAFLFSRAVEVGLPPKFLEAGNRAVDFVVKHGVNRDGSIPHELNYDQTVRDRTLVWWTQTELLRALAHFVVQRERRDLAPTLFLASAYAKAHYIDPVYGGWYEQPDRNNLPKGHDWMAGYHVSMMLTEMLRLQGESFKSGKEMLL
jgi:mannose/cellobiose epimerase-like protein (N-acyl-D-glucosamine 2-epimerase family)